MLNVHLPPRCQCLSCSTIHLCNWSGSIYFCINFVPRKLCSSVSTSMLKAASQRICQNRGSLYQALNSTNTLQRCHKAAYEGQGESLKLHNEIHEHAHEQSWLLISHHAAAADGSG